MTKRAPRDADLFRFYREAAGSAEDAFAYFDLSFDPRVTAVSRRHILKRFHDRIAHGGGVEGLDDPAARDVYCEFAAGVRPAAPAFPGLVRKGGGFVALSNVRRSKKPPPESKTGEGATP